MTNATRARGLLLTLAVLLPAPAAMAAQDSASIATTIDNAVISDRLVSPEAQAVLDRMTRYLRGLEAFSVDTHASRDEVVGLGYKLQNNERSTLVVQRPDKLRAEISGDVRNRTFVYDGGALTMYSPDDAAYVEANAPSNIASLIETLLDHGIEMPLIDVLYQGTTGTLAADARGGILVGSALVGGVACDHLAFRQASVDWQMWVEQGNRPLPRRILITTRYEVGEPQYEANLNWDLKPRIEKSTFAFTPPRGAVEIPMADTLASDVAPREELP